MRSEVGAFWPRSRRPALLVDRLPCVAPPVLDRVDFFADGLCAFPAVANTPSPATISSDRARHMIFRSLIGFVLRSACRLLLTVRRNFARQVERQYPVTVLASKDLEDHFVARLQFGHRLAVLDNRVDCRAIDFRNDVAAAKSQVFRKGSRFDFGHKHALLPFHSYTAATFGSQLLNVQAEFGRGCLTRLVTHPARCIREYAGTIFDNRGRCKLLRFALLVRANVLDLDFTSDGRLRNWVHQVVAGLYGMTVHAGDDVTALQAGFLCRASCLNAFDCYAVRRAEMLEGNAIGTLFFLEADTNQAAGHAPLLADLVVNFYVCR